MFFQKCTLHDFPVFALFSHTIVKMSEGTFCRVEVHIIQSVLSFAASFPPLNDFITGFSPSKVQVNQFDLAVK